MPVGRGSTGEASHSGAGWDGVASRGPAVPNCRDCDTRAPSLAIAALASSRLFVMTSGAGNTLHSENCAEWGASGYE